MNATTRWITGLCIAGLIGTLGALAGCQSQPAPASAKANRTYSFWPQFPDDPHVQFLASYSSSEDVAPTHTSNLERIVFGKESTKEALIDKPYGVAMRDGKIYVADMRGKALAVLDLKKRQTRLVGISGTNRLQHPVAVAVAADGMIYVADNDRGCIFVYDASERYSQVFGFPQFKPVGVAVHGDRLYAVDLAEGHQNVVIFNRKDGKKLGVIGTVGDEDGQFRAPLGVATDGSGNVYVSDTMRCNLQKFSPEGQYIATVGKLGDYVGSFARPKHIAVDGDGIIYAVDAAFDNVQMFDAEFRTLMHFGAMGSFPGAMDLPAGVTICDDSLDLFRDLLHPGFDAKRLVVVTNQFGPTKVVVYAVGSRRPEFSAQDLAASAAKLPTGTGVPSEDQLKIQNPGGVEVSGEPGAPTPGETPATPATPTPAPKPEEPAVPR